MRLAAPAAILLVSACASAPGASHVWQDDRSFDALSTTAMAITGPIAFSGGTLVFNGTETVGIESLGTQPGAWGDDGGEATAEVFRMASDPGTLLNGNTLCGGTARYAVFYQDDTLGPTLAALFFESEDAPSNADSPGLCGTFSYAID
ncbi:MAG TPA: hypothetical protein VFN28_15030 [Amaricoccus sp.]|nr:hypothetical protein [Amaricoccus sp.]